MDSFALVIGLALAAGLIAFILWPMRRARRTPETESQLHARLAQRESLYTQIRELDFDHATGKVTDADYTPLRAQLANEAAEVLRQIDALAATPASADALEAAIAARRKHRPAPDDADLEAAVAARRARAPAPDDANLEAAIAARRQSLTCPNCGQPTRAGDAFCARCGAALGTQVAR
jgi:hypothetical protein